MSHASRLVEEHCIEYESRLKHIDELFERARAANVPPALGRELDALATQRETLAAELAALQACMRAAVRRPPQPGLGPLAIWDGVARQLERLVERAGA